MISHVFPISWLKRFKRNRGNVQPGKEQAKRKPEVNEMSRCLSMPTEFKEGRFYSGTDDLYWRLSFGEASLDDEFVVRKGSRSRSWEGNRLRSNDIILEIKDVKKKQYKVKKEVTVINKDVQVKYQLKGMKRTEQRLKEATERSSNRRVLKEKTSDLNLRHLKKQESELRSVQKDSNGAKQLTTVKIRDELEKSRILDYKRKWNLLCPSCSAMMSKENWDFDDLDVEDANACPGEEFNPEIQRSERKKINKIISKNEHHRLSVHLRRRVRIKGRNANRIINSPSGKNAAKTDCKTRTTEFIKIEKRTERMIEAEATTAFDSYAVQKSSYDPQQDFRASMLEMIIEKEIKQPEELEELLVCYLTHNCVDYHDLIIKVFRQVWFDLNQVYFAAAW